MREVKRWVIVLKHISGAVAYVFLWMRARCFSWLPMSGHNGNSCCFLFYSFLQLVVSKSAILKSEKWFTCALEAKLTIRYSNLDCNTIVRLLSPKKYPSMLTSVIRSRSIYVNNKKREIQLIFYIYTLSPLTWWLRKTTIFFLLLPTLLQWCIRATECIFVTGLPCVWTDLITCLPECAVTINEAPDLGNDCQVGAFP